MRILITYFSILFSFPQQSSQRMEEKKKKPPIDSMSINIVFIQQIQNASIYTKFNHFSHFHILYYFEIYTYIWKCSSKHICLSGIENFSTVLQILFLLFILFNVTTFCRSLYQGHIDFDREILNLFDFLLYFSFIHSVCLILISTLQDIVSFSGSRNCFILFVFYQYC